MSKFIPKYKALDGYEEGFLIIDSPFSYEEGIEYAVKHNFDILFMCGTYTCACEILYKIQEAGYNDFKFVVTDHGKDVGCYIPVYDTVICRKV